MALAKHAEEIREKIEERWAMREHDYPYGCDYGFNSTSYGKEENRTEHGENKGVR